MVVSAIEQADVVDAGVPQDQRRPAGGDLPGSTARPFLVGMPFRVTAIEDDRCVTGYPECAHDRLEPLGRSAVPVRRILEPVGVEIERPGDVILLVLFRNAEVDMEQLERAQRRRLGPSSVQQLAKPIGVDELLVVRQAVNRQGRIGGPLGPTTPVNPDSGLAQLGEPRLERDRVLRTIAIQDDLATLKDALRLQQPLHLGLVDAVQPRNREGDRSGDVTPSGRTARAPAVVGRQCPDVDYGQVGGAELLAKFGQGDGHPGRPLLTTTIQIVNIYFYSMLGANLVDLTKGAGSAG